MSEQVQQLVVELRELIGDNREARNRADAKIAAYLDVFGYCVDRDSRLWESFSPPGTRYGDK